MAAAARVPSVGIDKKEAQMFTDIAAGLPMADVVRRLYGSLG